MSIFSASQYMTEIINEFRRFRYNYLPMVICTLGDLFQAKEDKLLIYIKGVKIYINDVLVLSK